MVRLWVGPGLTWRKLADTVQELPPPSVANTRPCPSRAGLVWITRNETELAPGSNGVTVRLRLVDPSSSDTLWMPDSKAPMSIADPLMPRTPLSVTGWPLQTGGFVSSEGATANLRSSIPYSSKPPDSNPEVIVTPTIGRREVAPKKTGVSSFPVVLERERVSLVSSAKSSLTDAGVAWG